MKISVPVGLAAAVLVVSGCTGDPQSTPAGGASGSSGSAAETHADETANVASATVEKPSDDEVCLVQTSAAGEDSTCYRFVSAKIRHDAANAQEVVNHGSAASRMSAEIADIERSVDWGMVVAPEVKGPYFTMLRRNVKKPVHRSLSSQGTASVSFKLQPQESVVVETVYTFVEAEVEVTSDAEHSRRTIHTQLPLSFGITLTD